MGRKLSDKKGIAHLVELCYERGLRRVILSPGSRNAPLSISFLGHGEFDVRVIGDERVAGYMALGMSQADRQATILVCTSGSAMLNYGPAVSEACYQEVPMLVLTADRPEEWVNQMEGQTMRQQGALSNFVNAEFQLPQEAQEEDRLWYNDRIVNEAITATQFPKQGPVHINIPLKEPLYGTMDFSDNVKVITPMLAKRSSLAAADWDALRQEISTYKKVMVIMGQSLPEEIETRVLQGLQTAGIVIMNETSSNAAGDNIYSWIDRSIAAIPPEREEEFLPELIITFGGPLVSKRIKTLLRGHHPAGHWHIAPARAEVDLFQSLTRAIHMRPADFLDGLLDGNLNLNSAYSSHWSSLIDDIAQRHEQYIADCPYSDLKAYSAILPSIPADASIQMANSAAVRYVQVFPAGAGQRYYGNRGVSGIEGCTSTAVGMAVHSDTPVVLLTGDMAFRYDANAFWQKDIPNNLKCIVINNQGGGIFRIIPGPESTDHLESAFEAHQDNNAKGIAELYKIPYIETQDMDSLHEGLQTLFADDRTMILEVHTPREQNAKVLRDYFKYLRES